jgi:hypothetical protein
LPLAVGAHVTLLQSSVSAFALDAITPAAASATSQRNGNCQSILEILSTPRA